jgi:hypothetical protein
VDATRRESLCGEIEAVIPIRCFACGRESEVSDYLAGLTIVCKNCGNRIEVAGQLNAATVSPAATAIRETPPDSPNPHTSANPPGIHAVQAPLPAILPSSLPAGFHQLPKPRSIMQHTADNKPVWAVERAKAMLSLGQTEPKIVEQLVSKGLSQEEATAIVDGILEEGVRKQVEPIRRVDRHNRIHRSLSALVAILTVLAAFYFYVPEIASLIAIRVSFIVAIIWFPDYIGAFGSRLVPWYTIHAIFIRWIAWLVLVLYCIRIVSLGLAASSSD